MDAYGEKMGKRGLKFLFDGRRISADMTAEDLGLENEDVIEANLEQLGGFWGQYSLLRHRNKLNFTSIK